MTKPILGMGSPRHPPDGALSPMKHCVLLAVVFIFLGGCRSERSTEVRLEGEALPIFVLSGSGRLAIFTISALPSEEKISSPYSVMPLWRIEAESGYLSGRPVEEIGKLTYGRLPAGYKQVYPESNQSPQPILPGTIYEFYFETTGAPHARGLFEVQKGKTVKLDRPAPCFQQHEGQWQQV